jgi:zinc protease
VPDSSTDDFFALQVMNAALTGPTPIAFSGGGGTNRSSRLYQALVETEKATSIGGSLALTHDPYLYDVQATVRTGHTLEEVEGALSRELEVLATDSITTSELEKAIKQSRAEFAYATEQASNQAYWLGLTEVLGSHTWFERYIERLSAVTVDDVQRVAETYLTRSNRTVGWYVPN